MKFQHRPTKVEAVQWTLHNLDAVRAIASDAYTVDCGWTMAIPSDIRNSAGERINTLAHAGDYIVRLSDGKTFAMTQPRFEQAYELVPDHPQEEVQP